MADSMREKMDFAEKLAFDMWASAQYPQENGYIENWLSSLYQTAEKQHYRWMAKLALSALAAMTDEDAILTPDEIEKAVQASMNNALLPSMSIAKAQHAKTSAIERARAAQEQKELAVVLARKEERIAIGTELERVLTQINSPKVNKKIVETLKCGQALRSDKG